MHKKRVALLIVLLWPITCLSANGSASAQSLNVDAASAVAREVRPVMRQYGIPGMAIGVTLGGRHYVYTYGVASRETRKRVDSATLFEIGSITKTFTATLAAYAELTGRLALFDTVSSDFPTLRGSSFDRVKLVNLGTHTAGGLPLQLPDNVISDDGALQYYKHWKPAHAAGTYRRYSNPSIMLLGLVTAKRLNADFAAALQSNVIAPLGLQHTYLTVPASQASHYAQGYTDTDLPKRMTAGPLYAEAYGIRTTAPDLLRFLDANLNLGGGGGTLRRALDATHTGYYRAGRMTQDLIWEQYRYPASLGDLLQGNSDHMIFDDNAVMEIKTPLPPQNAVWIDKTGSTNGFGAYVAFVPLRQTGIVVLANKAYPIAARVRLAYRILDSLPHSR